MLKPRNVDWSVFYFAWLSSWIGFLALLVVLLAFGLSTRVVTALIAALGTPVSPVPFGIAIVAGIVSKRRSEIALNAERAVLSYTCGRCGVALRIDEPHPRYGHMAVCDACAKHLNLTPAQPTAP